MNQLGSEVLSSGSNISFTSLLLLLLLLGCFSRVRLCEMEWFTILTSLFKSPPLTSSAPDNLEKAMLYSYHLYMQPIQIVFCQSQWSVGILMKDLWNLVVFRPRFLILFPFLPSFSLALGENSAFSLMVSYQLYTSSPKGCPGVFYEWQWKQSQLTQQGVQGCPQWRFMCCS